PMARWPVRQPATDHQPPGADAARHAVAGKGGEPERPAGHGSPRSANATGERPARDLAGPLHDAGRNRRPTGPDRSDVERAHDADPRDRTAPLLSAAAVAR